MSPLRAGLVLAAGLALTWLHPLPTVTGNYVADFALVGVLIVALAVPIEVAILLAATIGLLQGGLSGAPFGARAITLTLVAALAARTARTVHVDSPLIRPLFIAGWSIGAIVLDSLVARWLFGSGGLPAFGPTAARVVATTIAGLLLWRLVANRREPGLC